MSYELRTPLNAIIGFAEVMSARLMGPLPERYANYADDIRDSGKHLLALVERILEMSRLEADSRPFEDRPVDLAEIARAAATLTRPEVDGAAGRIEIESGGPAIARGDATALRQIAVDLLVNAARHGRKGGRIVVRTGPGAGGRVRLTVADDGPGLPGDVLTGAGVPFLGRRSEVADGSGLGLGLAISTELVGRMGGNLELANADPGARVTLDMPAAEAARDAA
jgi:signal transduction histidine kinase